MGSLHNVVNDPRRLIVGIYALAII